MSGPDYETTCPQCDHVFDVAGDAERSRCPNCGVTIEFEDEAPAHDAVSAQIAAEAEAFRREKEAQRQAAKEAEAAERAQRRLEKEQAAEAKRQAKQAEAE